MSTTPGYGVGGSRPIAPPPSGLPYVEPEQLSRSERILIAATPIATAVGIVAFGYPPYQALTRYRVAHNPIGSDAGKRTGPAHADTSSFWAVVKAVRRKEGKSGFYKGLILNLSVGVAPWITVLGGYGLLRLFPRAAPSLLTGKLATFGWQAITTLITLPFELLAVRALATPHTLPLTTPLSNLRLLLTADERARPFKSFYTPSRFLASFLPTLITPFSSAYLLPFFIRLCETEQQTLIAYLLSQIVLAVGLRTPLAVLAARLNAQRTGGTGAAIVHEKGDEEASVEGVVQIRPTPYRNIWEAAKTMVNEEGWYSLWRGWPLEALLALRTYA